MSVFRTTWTVDRFIIGTSPDQIIITPHGVLVDDDDDTAVLAAAALAHVTLIQGGEAGDPIVVGYTPGRGIADMDATGGTVHVVYSDGTTDSFSFPTSGVTQQTLDAAIATRAPLLVQTGVKTGAYTASTGDLVPVDASSANVTITLPAAAVGRQVAVRWDAGTGHTVTVATAGSDKLGSGTDTAITLDQVGHSVLLQAVVSGRWSLVSEVGASAGVGKLSELTDVDTTGAAVGGVPAVSGTGPTAFAVVPAQASAAPTAKFVGQTYRSTALKDLAIPTDVAQRPVVFSPTGVWEGQAIQELSLWIANSKINALFTAGSGLGYASCPIGADPTIAANWSRPVTYTSAVISGAKHASTFVEAGTIYCYFVDQATSGKVMLTSIATSADPTVAANWSTPVQVMTLPTGASVFGNTRVVKDPDSGTYYMIIEYKVTATGRWQMGEATCSPNSPTGTWSLISGAEILTSLWPNADRQGSGGAWLAKENGQWVIYYHASINWNGLLPCDIYRATAPSLGADNWTLTNGGRPIVARVAAHEVDQVADVELLRTPDGAWYGFWTGMHNRGTFTGRIAAARLMPALRQWNGTTWIAADLTPETVRPTRDPAKPRTLHLASDFTSTLATGTWEDIPGLSLTFAPTGTDCEIEVRGVFSPSGSSGFKYLFQVLKGATAVPLGALAGTTGQRGTFVGVAKFTQLTPGTYLPFKVQVKVPSGGGTINCRPVAFVGEEYAVVKGTDIAYP